jgi:phosphoglycolate phosphatase
MTSFRFDIVGFDLDGTLLDTSGDLAAAVNNALASAGRAALTVDQVKPMIGGGARHMLAQALTRTGGYDEPTLDTLLGRLFDYYEANISVHTAPYPGCIAALDAIAARGAKLAVVTNKRESFSLTLLRDVGLLDRFACVIGGDTTGVAKPSPIPVQTMIERCGGGSAAFVGDSMFDVAAAKSAGIPAVACSFGFMIQPVEELGADAIIDHFDELLPALERL